MEKIGETPEKLDATIKKRPKEDPVGLFLERFGEALDIEHAVAGEIDFSYLAPEQRAESMWAVFQNIQKAVIRIKVRQEMKKEGREPKGGKGEINKDELNDLRLGLGTMRKLYEDEEVRKIYSDNYQRHLKESEAVNGDLEKYKTLKKTISGRENSLDDYARRIFGKRGKINEIDRLLFKTAKNNLSESRENMDELLGGSAELRVLDQVEKTKKYAKELRESGYMWLPSRRQFLEDFEEAALFGRPLLVFGESGTGKTELIKNAALKLTGLVANETPGKDTRFDSLIAKPKISAGGENYYEYQEIGEAATGLTNTMDEKRAHDGRIVIDDEFNLLSQSEQILRLSRIASWKPGKNVKMPVVNREVQIAPNFLYCASVNLASDKYSGGRSDIPLEVMRKFHRLEVGFIPQTTDNPEVFDAMIAALLDENGRLRVSKSEIAPDFNEKGKTGARSVSKDGKKITQHYQEWELKEMEETGGKKVAAGGFVWRLAGAINELNKSIALQETVLKSRGEGQHLGKVLIDIGRIVEWMQTYIVSEDKVSLEQFITEKIRDQFSEMKSFSDEDRQLTKEFFAYFDINLDSAREKPPGRFEIMTPRDIGLLSPRVKYEEITSEEPVLTESFYVSEEGKRIEYKIERLEQDGREFFPGEVYTVTKQDGKKYACKFLGINKENGLPAVVPYKKEPGKMRREKAVSSNLKTKWKNPETENEQMIEIDLEEILDKQKQFYKNNLNLEINESAVREIWNKNYAEIKSEIEKYGYDSVIIVPENLPSEADVNKKAIETMNEGAGKVAATKYWVEQQSISSAEENKYKIILTHSDQNIYENPAANPFLKATLGKNIPMLILNISPKEWSDMEDKEKKKKEQEAFQKLEQGADVDFEAEIDGKKIKIQAEGLSLEEYEIFQRIYFEKNPGKHLDEKGWTWLPKSRSGSRVVLSGWDPGDRRLHVHAAGPGGALGYLGLRLSRSFS